MNVLTTAYPHIDLFVSWIFLRYLLLLAKHLTRELRNKEPNKRRVNGDWRWCRRKCRASGWWWRWPARGRRSRPAVRPGRRRPGRSWPAGRWRAASSGRRTSAGTSWTDRPGSRSSTPGRSAWTRPHLRTHRPRSQRQFRLTSSPWWNSNQTCCERQNLLSFQRPM